MQLAPEDFPDDRPRIWRAVDALQIENAVTQEKLKTLEGILERHLDFHDGMATSLTDIRNKLETNGGILIEMKKDMASEKKRVDGIKSLPKSILTYLGIGATAILGWSQVWKWLAHSLDVKIK